MAQWLRELAALAEIWIQFLVVEYYFWTKTCYVCSCCVSLGMLGCVSNCVRMGSMRFTLLS